MFRLKVEKRRKIRWRMNQLSPKVDNGTGWFTLIHQFRGVVPSAPAAGD
ncbi:hypothetical protein KCP70_24725 [Salmonella enterica subsp. enterica]|nr:hypothetical protein KCP70_24725 [Salmonella enterica subsp. enterica]